MVINADGCTEITQYWLIMVVIHVFQNLLIKLSKTVLELQGLWPQVTRILGLGKTTIEVSFTIGVPR